MQAIIKPSVILSVFVGFKILQIMTAFKTGQGGPYVPWVLLLEVIIVGLGAAPVLRGKKLVLWVMGLYLLTQGGGGLLFGVLAPLHQYFLKGSFIVLGGYFLLAGLILLRQARRPTRYNAEQPAADGQAAAP